MNTSDQAARTERFRVLYDANHDDLWRYCLRRAASPEQAEDILGEVFLIAWKNLAQVPDPPGARPWLYGVARNHLRNRWRSAQRERSLTARLRAQVTTTAPDPADLAVDESGQVLEAVSRLRESDRELVQLAMWEHLPHDQIALVLGCTENAVAIRLHRARTRLARHIDATTKQHTKGNRSSRHVVDDGAHRQGGSSE